MRPVAMERGTSSDISIHNYDVFLSFRGPDTRQGLVSCLYHFMTRSGIRVFKDDEDLRPGQRIKAVLEAISNSKICIPVFSKDYPSSKWCLHELAKMVELEKEIMPIFYDVTPNDVKLRTGLYREKLGGFPESLASDVVKWENALVEVASIIGWELKDSGYGEFSERIVAELSMKLKVKEKILTDYLVGMEGQVEAVMKMLQIDSPDVRFVGIHGMGGVGKTTLAKVVFNQLHSRFSSAIYLENVRETWKRDGVTHLQRQMLNGLGSPSGDIHDWDTGIRKIRKIIHDQKVLIVFDDVNDAEQIEKLVGNSSLYCPGSRIIVTTRNAAVLNKVGVLQTLELTGLNPVQALQLFSRHAFEEESPPADFVSLSKEATLAAAGLPLALEVIGSLLHFKSIEEWDEIIKSIGSNQEIQKILMISYDSLEPRTKQIFLDIACLFINEEKTNCIYMWEACNFYPKKGLANLISMSLVKISNDNTFQMHDLLRDLGRDIVCQENLTDLGKRSRIWTHEDSLEILQREEGKENVQALRIKCEFNNRLTLGHEALRGLRNIRFLALDGLVIEGSPEHYMLPNLRWLSCDGFSSNILITSNLRNLVILDLYWSGITESWSHIQMANLKVLTLYRCNHVSKTLGFPKLTSLERLNIRNCETFYQIGGSIGALKRLKYLTLQGCVNLEGLPEEIGVLGELEMILVEGDGSSFSLPEAIGRLVKLKHLCLHKCRIEKLPDSLGNSKALVELDLSASRITELPDFFNDLKLLKVLKVRSSQTRELPRSFGMMELLETLDASHNTSLVEVPTEIGQLSNLRILDFSLTKIFMLPSTVSQLSVLRTLHLRDCHNLQELPELPKSLTSLEVTSKSLKKVPDLSELTNLTNLILSDAANYTFYHNFRPTEEASTHWFPRKPPSQGRNFRLWNWSSPKLQSSSNFLKPCSLDWIGNLTKLVSLHLDLSFITTPPSHLGSLSCLESLRLSCRGWECFPQLPCSLRSLTLGHLLPTTQFPALSNLRKLTDLGLFNFTMDGDGLARLGIAELEWLRTVSISNGNFSELNLQHFPEKLRRLKLDECRSLKRLCNLSRLKNLGFLELSVCEELTEIEDPDEVALSVLSVVGRSALKLKGIPVVGFSLNCRNHRRNRSAGQQSQIYLYDR